MSAAIKGITEVIRWARQQPPGSASVYVNWDAIADMPEEFEAVVSKVTFDKARLGDHFTNVGTSNKPSFYPMTDLMYKIGNARGVSGGLKTASEKLIEEVDINPLLMKPSDAEPTFRRRHVGHKVSKYSTVINPDGSERRSSLCTSEYDAWTRCLENWLAEDARRLGGEQAPNWGWKYDTTAKRELSLAKELKHSAAKAETKAHCKTIRELAGLPTGFSPKQLADGQFVFDRVQRSEIAVKGDAAARRVALSRGLGDGGNGAAAALFGPEAVTPEQEPVQATPDPPAADDWSDAEILDQDDEMPSEKIRALSALSEYKRNGYVPDKPDAVTRVGDAIKWLETADENAETFGSKFAAVLRLIARLENEGFVPDGKYAEHHLALPSVS